MRTVGQAVAPLDRVTVAVELGGAPGLVDVGGGAGAVGDVLGDAGDGVVAVLEGEEAQLAGFGEASCNKMEGWHSFLKDGEIKFFNCLDWDLYCTESYIAKFPS